MKTKNLINLIVMKQHNAAAVDKRDCWGSARERAVVVELPPGSTTLKLRSEGKDEIETK